MDRQRVSLDTTQMQERAGCRRTTLALALAARTRSFLRGGEGGTGRRQGDAPRVEAVLKMPPKTLRAWVMFSSPSIAPNRERAVLAYSHTQENGLFSFLS